MAVSTASRKIDGRIQMLLLLFALDKHSQEIMMQNHKP